MWAGDSSARSGTPSGWFAVLGAIGSTLSVWLCCGISTPMSLRSPLGQVLGTGSAKDGTGQWWAQRVSAVALIPLDFVVLFLAAGLPSLDFGVVRAGWPCRVTDFSPCCWSPR